MLILALMLYLRRMGIRRDPVFPDALCPFIALPMDGKMRGVGFRRSHKLSNRDNRHRSGSRPHRDSHPGVADWLHVADPGH